MVITSTPPTARSCAAVNETREMVVNAWLPTQPLCHRPSKRHSWRTLLGWLSVVCLMLCSALAQADRINLEQRLEHRRWSHSDDNPSQIGAMVETQGSYLWLGTHDSLYRFDGINFTSYRSLSGHDLGIVSSLLASDTGLWVGLRNGGVGLIRPDDNQITLFDLNHGVIYALAETPDGRIWAAANDGLFSFDGERWTALGNSDGFLGQNAYSLFVDRDARLWVADEQRLYYLEPGAQTLYDSGHRSNRTRQITQAPDGALWLIERGSESLLRIEPDEREQPMTTIATGATINAMLFARDGSLWLSTAGAGVLHVANPDRHDGKGFYFVERFSTRNGLSSDFAWPLFEGREDSVWVGTQNGLDRLRERPLLPAGFPTTAHNLALGVDSLGNLWAGSANFPVMRLDNEGLHYLPLKTPINTVSKDPQGSVWLAGPEGIWRSVGNQLQKVSSLPVDRELDSSVRSLLIDEQGTPWLSLNRQGLYVLLQDQWHRLPAPSDDPAQLMPVASALAPDGRRWFGYRNNLVVSYDAQGERHWSSAEGLDIGHVTAMAHLQGHSWFGGQRGLAHFDGSRFTTLPLPGNGLFDNLYAIIPVSSEHGEDLWLHGKGGIFQLPAEEIRRAQADSGYHIRYRTYDLRGGLDNDPQQVLAVPTGVSTTDGTLWFITRDGVVGLDPKRQQQDSAVPHMLIQSMVADGANIPLHGTPALPADIQRVVIDYRALCLAAPDGLHYLYRLDGFDNDWHHAGRQREAIYTGLPAGTYRFRVRALNQNGMQSEEDAELTFTIAQVFYRHPLFLLTLALAALLALHLSYRQHVQRVAERLRTRLEERHEERERIARELHDTLLQGVQGLMLHVQAAADSTPADDPMRNKLEQALDRAEQSILEGRERVRSLRHTPNIPDDLPRLLCSFAHLQEQGDASYRVAVEGTPRPLHPVVYDEITQVAREAINNAFRHAQASNIDVQLNYDPREFTLRISDDGRGIPPGYIHGRAPIDHWGIKGMHERALKVGGTLRIDTTSGQGSHVSLTLAGQLAYPSRPTARSWRHWKRLFRSPPR